MSVIYPTKVPAVKSGYD